MDQRKRGRGRGRGVATKVLGTALIVLAIGCAGGLGTYAAFSSPAVGSGKSFEAGTISITDDEGASAVVSLGNAKPGDTSTGCVNITYRGSMAASVRMHASVTGGLAPYTRLTVTRGTGDSPSNRDCSNFTADPASYIGAGAGVVYSGSLSSYPASYDLGIRDAPGRDETWTTGETHSYRISVSLDDDNLAQGRSAGVTFIWEARSL